MAKATERIKATNLNELKKLLNETSDLLEQLEVNLEKINAFVPEVELES